MNPSHLPSLGRTRLGRRGFLLGLSTFAVAGRTSLALAALPAAGDRRLVVVLLRGAMDGLHAVVPYGDAAYAELRQEIALPEPGEEGGVLDCGGFFGLNPALTRLHEGYAEGIVLPIHAVAGGLRSRSHFDAQDYLERGSEQRLSSGWLNRAISAMEPDEGESLTGLSVGLDLPLLLRGRQRIGMWAPPQPVRPAPDLYARMHSLLHEDPVLGPAVEDGLRERGYADGMLPSAERNGPRGFVALASAAGRLLAADDGPRVAAIELGGWDTHAAQAARMTPVLAQLDAGLGELRAQLGAAWAHTAVLCVTEFGRTARVNGNSGTDHGTGGVAFLLGGPVQGGRILADWPGLGQDRLFENRDLQPTRDLRAVAKGLLRDHMRLPDAAVAAAFPDSEGVTPQGGLIRRAA